MRRKQRFDLRQSVAAATKRVNGARKGKEQIRRRSRMMAKLEAGSLPYTPGVMSWLTDELGKPANRITAADIKTLVGSAA